MPPVARPRRSSSAFRSRASAGSNSASIRSTPANAPSRCSSGWMWRSTVPCPRTRCRNGPCPHFQLTPDRSSSSAADRRECSPRCAASKADSSRSCWNAARTRAPGASTSLPCSAKGGSSRSPTTASARAAPAPSRTASSTPAPPSAARSPRFTKFSSPMARRRRSSPTPTRTSAPICYPTSSRRSATRSSPPAARSGSKPKSPISCSAEITSAACSPRPARKSWRTR